MKKYLFAFCVAILFVGMALTGCKNKTGGETNGAAAEGVSADSIATDSVVSENEPTYFPAIDRYLVDEIGKQYAEGEYCVPMHSIVRVDERNSEDILVWGDFWVFNYNLSGDTLNTVSGGNHPGLMHVRQTESGYEVTGFEQVADGAKNITSAKQIFGDMYEDFCAINSDEQKREQLRAEVLANYAKKQGLKATMYKDFGWPAKKLP